jgi:hypothetical protein
MKVVCVNSDNKPAKIPESEWIKKGNVYTVIKAVPMGLQPGKFGFKLEEVELSPSSFPYEYYESTRFAVPTEVEKKVMELEEAEFSL